MESQQPMDRLVCGDVGFGKTEVAIRAAFKAADNSKQVVILVPTTILAFQHYKTFSNRLKELPVRVDYINRFRSSKDRTQRLQDLTSYLHAIWYSFLQIVLAIFFLWKYLGPSCMGGVSIIIIMIPVSKNVAAYQGKIQKQLMHVKDDRVDLNLSLIHI